MYNKELSRCKKMNNYSKKQNNNQYATAPWITSHHW